MFHQEMKNDFWWLEAAKNSINDGSNCYSDSRSAAAPTSINFKMKMKKKKKDLSKVLLSISPLNDQGQLKLGKSVV